MWGLVCLWWSHLVRPEVCPLGELVGSCGRLWGLSLLLWCVPSLLVALLLCAWRVACKYASISRSKGVFSGFWGFRLGLLGLGAVRGLCGFCVREWLGGYMA